jgi:hypothetical protein
MSDRAYIERDEARAERDDLKRRLSDEQQTVLAVLRSEAEWQRRALEAEAALRAAGYKWPLPEPDDPAPASTEHDPTFDDNEAGSNG